VIIGPTASGKSDLGVLVAHALRERGVASRIVTADAFQIYRGMDIGTAKPSESERGGVAHELVDIVAPSEALTAADWLARARACIDACRERGEVPIVVGGTHLYIKLLVDGMFEGPAADVALRERLHALPADELRAMLERVDPASASKLHRNDVRRTVRAIEVYELTGKPMSEHQRQWDPGTPALRAGRSTPWLAPSDFRLVVVDWPTPLLNRRINARVKRMMERGLLEEVRWLHARGEFGPQAIEALGYKQLVEHLRGRCTLQEGVEAIKVQTRHFAKAQRTWLKRLGARPGALRLDMTELLAGWPWDEDRISEAQAAELLACTPTREQAERVVRAVLDGPA
jgi:tRNA dimethylallyltransferase